MAETTTPSAVDLLSVRSRISWGAVAAGAMVALAIYFVLTVLGLALGIEVAFRRNDINLTAGAAIYAIVTMLVAMFFGGWTTSRLAVGETKFEAALYGVILWGVLFVGLIWMFAAGIRTGFGALVGLASGVYTATSEVEPDGGGPGSPPTAVLAEAIRQRYNSEFGDDRFAADLQKLGLSPEEAEKVQAEVGSTLDRVRDDPTALVEGTRRVAARPAFQDAYSAVADRAREVTWWTLAGVIISMVTVILGSLMGAGEIFQPVPILGVRRPTVPVNRA